MVGLVQCSASRPRREVATRLYTAKSVHFKAGTSNNSRRPPIRTGRIDTRQDFNSRAPSVTVVVGLVRPVYRDSEIVDLGGAELGEGHAKLLQMESGDLLVEMLW